ncbi:MAG: hypothetical protein K5669_04715 [Lachnospiraceae bacterium]|nr:hypothetical protein [Lachnospiraceae bacterium]
MKNKKPLFVLYDEEEEYTLLMSDYLKDYPGMPWKIHAYTKEKDLMDFEIGSDISMMVVSEGSYCESLKELDADKVIILNESGYKRDDDLESVDKYQAAEAVLQILLQEYLEIAGEQPGKINASNKTKFIGVYSPVKRCMQTTFAMTMSEILSEKKSTLYLNFENYAGVAQLLAGEGERDLSDLVYFMNVENEKFKLHLQTTVKQIGEMSFVPPMKYGMNLLSVTEGEWLALLSKISESGLFEYVVMDLTDSLQGLPEILRICSRVYTVSRDDSYAKVKMLQYENLLSAYDYRDILEKTERFVFPKFHYIPANPDEYGRGEIADFVRNKMYETGVC